MTQRKRPPRRVVSAAAPGIVLNARTLGALAAAATVIAAVGSGVGNWVQGRVQLSAENISRDDRLGAIEHQQDTILRDLDAVRARLATAASAERVVSREMFDEFAKRMDQGARDESDRLSQISTELADIRRVLALGRRGSATDVSRGGQLAALAPHWRRPAPGWVLGEGRP